MTLLLLIVSIMGIIAINKGNKSLEAINRIQGIELNNLYLSSSNLLRMRATSALAVRKMEVGLIDDGAENAKRAAEYAARSQLQLKQFIDANTVTAQGKKLSRAVSVSYQRYFEGAIAPMMRALSRQSPDDYYDILEGNISQLAASFGRAVDDFSLYANQVSAMQLRQAAQNEMRMKALIAICCLLTLMLTASAWFILNIMLLKPLNNAIRHLEHIAAGDLTQAMPQGGHNEPGRLNGALGRMQQALRQSVSRVRDASLQIDIGSRELSAGNQNLAQRTEESAASLEQTAASMEQLTATVRLNADNAHQAHQLARSVSETADRGAEVVCYVMEKMREISSSSARIADILGAIDGIAFQTNILALNASVEAARAGEQGRGFAVVANEVRNLAQRSANAAKEIRVLISDSQSRVGEGTMMATRAGETMDEISSEVMRVTALMKEISSASQEQSRGIEQVNQAVTQMDEVAQHNAALVEQATVATQSLEEQAQQLVQSMSLFKISRQ